MLLNSTTQLGLAFTKAMQEELYRIHYGKYLKDKDFTHQVIATSQVADLFNNSGNKNYYITKTALDIASRIKIDKDKLNDFDFLCKGLPMKKCTFLMGKDKFYRWNRSDENGEIMVICVKITRGDEEFKKQIQVIAEAFKHLSTNQILTLIKGMVDDGEVTAYQGMVLENAIKSKDFSGNMPEGLFYSMWGIRDGKLFYPEHEKNEEFYNDMIEFVKILVFTELSEIELEVLKPKQSVGTRNSGTKISNQSLDNITIVNSSWNKILIRTDGFKVTGHLRLQPYGPNMELRKLIYIEDYEKSGYIRNAVKE